MTDNPAPGSVPSKPGILFVASKVLHPDVLDPLDFTDWYENTHIQEVQSTGGISGTQRYESLSFHARQRDTSAPAGPENQNLAYDFLTVYSFPDLAFRETDAFNSLDGQSMPNEVLLEKLFKQTAFITRFAEEVSVSGPPEAAPYLISIATSSQNSARSILPACPPGSLRKLVVREGSLLSEFNRHWQTEPGQIVLIEADDMSQLEALEKDLEGSKDVEVGFWRLRRNYQGTERKPAGWKPK